MKKLLLIIMISLISLAVMVNVKAFDKENVNVEISGIENKKYDAKITYRNDFYVCHIQDKKSTYINGDEIIITCENNLLPFIKKNFKYGIDSLLSSEFDNRDVLLTQWQNRGIQRIVAVYKSNEELTEVGNAYLTISMNGNGKGSIYFDSNILYDSKNERYVKWSDNEIHEYFESRISATIDSVKDNVELYEKGINGYKRVYLNSDLMNK